MTTTPDRPLLGNFRAEKPPQSRVRARPPPSLRQSGRVRSKEVSDPLSLSKRVRKTISLWRPRRMSQEVQLNRPVECRRHNRCDAIDTSRKETVAEEIRPAEGAGDGGGQRKQGESLDPKRPRTASHARIAPTLTHSFTHDPDQRRRGRVSVVCCAPLCLRATFSRDTTAVVAHNVGRAASSEVCGRRMMNPVGNTPVPPQPRWDLK